MAQAMKMKPEIKKKWVKALRSGSYPQGQGVLKDVNGNMCCLGVLCEIHAKETGKNWEATQDGTAFKYQGTWTSLPDDVVKWAGLEDSNPTIEGSFLSRHNDGICSLTDSGGVHYTYKPKNFNQIADLIEANL